MLKAKLATKPASRTQAAKKPAAVKCVKGQNYGIVPQCPFKSYMESVGFLDKGTMQAYKGKYYFIANDGTLRANEARGGGVSDLGSWRVNPDGTTHAVQEESKDRQLSSKEKRLHLLAERLFKEIKNG